MNVEDRLAKLERESKSWRRIALGLALVFGVSLSCSQGTQAPTASQAFAAAGNETFDTIRAHNLEIVDASGEIVASLSNVDSGASLRLSSTGDSGNAVGLIATAYGASCAVIGKDHTTRMMSAEISLERRDSMKARAFERYSAKKRRGEEVDESEEKSFAQLSRRPDASLCTIGVTAATGGGIIDIYNPLGNNVVTMQSNKTNRGSVIVYDVNGTSPKALSAD